MHVAKFVCPTHPGGVQETVAWSGQNNDTYPGCGSIQLHCTALPSHYCNVCRTYVLMLTSSEEECRVPNDILKVHNVSTSLLTQKTSYMCRCSNHHKSIIRFAIALCRTVVQRCGTRVLCLGRHKFVQVSQTLRTRMHAS